jgi:hypothetical protein
MPSLQSSKNDGIVQKTTKPTLVGARGFEPPTSSTPLKRATELRYAPTMEASIACGPRHWQIAVVKRTSSVTGGIRRSQAPNHGARVAAPTNAEFGLVYDCERCYNRGQHAKSAPRSRQPGGKRSWLDLGLKPACQHPSAMSSRPESLHRGSPEPPPWLFLAFRPSGVHRVFRSTASHLSTETDRRSETPTHARGQSLPIEACISELLCLRLLAYGDGRLAQLDSSE